MGSLVCYEDGRCLRLFHDGYRLVLLLMFLRRRVWGVGFQYGCEAPEGTDKVRGILAKPQVQDSDPHNPWREPGCSEAYKGW